MAKAITAPSGLTIKRDNVTFAFTWKLGDDYTDQQLQYRTNNRAWTTVAVHRTTSAKSISLPKASYYPNTSKKVSSLTFRVRGKMSGAWSAWKEKTLDFDVPRTPYASADPDDTDLNVCKFGWALNVSDQDSREFTEVQWQSILVTDSSVRDGSKLKWTSSARGWRTGSSSSDSDYTTITEDANLIAKGSHTRWFRVRSRGFAGNSVWRYTKRVYAVPYRAKIEKATLTRTSSELTCYVRWKAPTNGAHPTEHAVVEYAIETPNAGMTAPSEATWTVAETIRDTSAKDAVSFKVSGTLGLDKALFVRVNTEHDRYVTYGIPKVVGVGKLNPPSNVSVSVNDSTHRATITATNESGVPDSFLVVLYRDSAKPNNTLRIGIIESGESSVTVQCPDWGSAAVGFGVYAVVGTYTAKTRADGVSSYSVVSEMQSARVWTGGQIPLAPSNVSISQTDTAGTIFATWDWSWDEANSAVISWADHADAWESTDEPSEYTISNLNASQWYISGLETGKKWYVRVRLVKTTGDNETLGPWSEIEEIDLSTAPTTPALTLSAGVITTDGSVTASWGYTSTDGTGQAYAEICEASVVNDEIVYGDVIAQTQTAQHVTINAEDVGWLAGETHGLCVRVVSASGKSSDEWSEPAYVTVAEPLDVEITESSLQDVQITYDEGDTRTVLCLTEMPLEVTVTGAGTGGTTTVSIERAAEYHVDTPDEAEFTGFKGEIIATVSQLGEAEITVSADDLIGSLDDGADYNLVATVQDGLGQSASVTLPFTVAWSHQAVIPEASVVIDGSIAKITAVAPASYVEGDTVDIYRLSADKPELIVRGGAFGTTYVDPYPAIGEFGGHRVVYKTVNGDYITANNEPAWIDLTEDDGDIFESEESIINFGGEEVRLYYDVDLSSQWEKDFVETKYLGGAVQGDWNAGVKRTASVSATMISIVDQDTIRALRRLAVHTGICHIRTLDGSSYACDIQVSEDRAADRYNKVAGFAFVVTRVDSQELDGLTLEMWSGQ